MPRKASEGRLDDIRTCVGASEGCIGRLRQGKAITCVQNPMIGREAELGVITPGRSGPEARGGRRRRRGRSGSGAGGRAARPRGDAPRGARRRSAARSSPPPARRSARTTRRSPHWLVAQVRKAGVEVRLNTPADAADVLALDPDAVVVATGADAARARTSRASTSRTSPPPSTCSLGQVPAGRRAASSSTRTATSRRPPPPTSSPAGLPGHAHLPLLHGGRGHRRGRPLGPLRAPLRPRAWSLLPMTVAIAIAAGRRPHPPHLLRGRDHPRGRHRRARLRRQGQRQPLPRARRARCPELQLVGDAVSPRRIHDAILEGTRVARAL